MTDNSAQHRLLNIQSDFEGFFHDVVEFQKSQFEKMGRDFPNQVLWVIKDGRIDFASIDVTYTGAIINNRFTEFPANIYGRPVQPHLVVNYLLAACNPQAYVVAYQGWTTKEKTRGTDFPGPIADLPPNERLEILVFIGRSLDGLQAYSKYFEVKREIHGEDSSRLVGMVELKGWRAVNTNDLQPMH